MTAKTKARELKREWGLDYMNTVNQSGSEYVINPNPVMRCRICHGTDDLGMDRYGITLCGRHRRRSTLHLGLVSVKGPRIWRWLARLAVAVRHSKEDANSG